MLFHQYYPCENCEQTPVLIVPGLFGSTPNWRTFARHLSKTCPVYVIDQRNHGQSPKYDSNTYADMVADLLTFIDQQGLDKVVLLGHSMGGKVAYLFSAMYPQRVDKLIVMDIAPVTYSHSHAPYIESLLALNLSNLKSRSEADRALKPAITDNGIRLFLLQSLERGDDGYQWQLNLPVLLEFMDEIRGFPNELIEGKQYLGSSLLLYGVNSDYMLDEHRDLVAKILPNVEIVGIEDAGHWLHVEQMKAVLAATSEFIEDL